MNAPPRGFAASRRCFALLLGIVFFSAFISLAVQVRGLFGAAGIMPASEFLHAVQRQLGARSFWEAPSLCWLGSSDATLLGLSVLGAVLALVMAAGFAPGACSLACWAIYLSLCSVGSPFLNFQWDALLLETALLAAWWLPWRLRPAWTAEADGKWIARWLLWWLLFRFTFESGIVKLTWGDATWWNLSALDFHFETQPLPLWTAWYLHHAPRWLLRAITAGMFIIEIGAPFTIAAPRRWRHAGGIALIALQIGILLTGNYTFFNLLTIALCLPLFDDACFPARWRAADAAPPLRPSRIAITFASIASLLGLPGFIQSFRIAVPEPLAQFRSFNGYGLFRVMTTERPEVVIEGSNDGVVWTEYELPWKPGDLRRRPRLAAPHQPRVDWQMWFAALGDVRHNPWFVNLLIRTLQGSPEVLAFYDWNPFPKQPPKRIRAVLYDYRFTRDDEPGWWHRERRGLYCPAFSLDDLAK